MRVVSTEPENEFYAIAASTAHMCKTAKSDMIGTTNSCDLSVTADGGNCVFLKGGKPLGKHVSCIGLNKLRNFLRSLGTTINIDSTMNRNDTTHNELNTCIMFDHHFDMLPALHKTRNMLLPDSSYT